jgi:hypothetical protein
MPQNLQKLKELSRFESLFKRDNLLLGLRMWLRVNLAMLAVALVLGATGALNLLGMSSYAVLLFLSILLYQWSITVEARKLYGFTPSPWCWWSVIWRMIVFMLPVFFIMLLVAGPVQPDPDGNYSESDLEKISNIQLITAFLSVIPMGLVTSRALLASLKGLDPSASGGYGSNDQQGSGK